MGLSQEYVIDVPVDMLKEMLLLGCARPVGDGYEITPHFQAWLDTWCEKRLREHPYCMCNTKEEGWRPCPPSLCEIRGHKHEEVE